jgi:hypothetical protein
MIDQGHVRHVEALDAARHEMHDAPNLAAIELPARLQSRHHRRRRLPLVPAQKGLAFGDRELDARPFHAVHLLDRARQLSLQGAVVVDLLHEIRDAEAAAIEELEARRAAVG